MSTLFPHLPFQNDETPMSWEARQAAFHTGGRVVSFLNDLKIPVADLVRGRRAAVERLCAVAGQDPEPVLENTIMAVGHRRYRLRECEFSAEFTTGVVTRVCPLCLKEDRDGAAWPRAATRHRLHWRLNPIRTCRRHRIPLANLRLGRWDDMLHEVQAMDDAVSAAYAVACRSEPQDPSELQCYVEDRFQGLSGPAWLDGQAIDQACRAAEMLGGLMAFGPDLMAAEMTEAMWHTAGRAAWPIVLEGDAAIRDFLCKQLLSTVKVNGHPSPRNSFGMLYGWLFASRLSKDPGPIRDIVRDVIIEHVPLVPGQMLLGQHVTTPRLASVTSIASAEGLHSKTLTKILGLAGVIDGASPLEGARNVVADYALAKPLIERAKHATPVTGVPEMLSASRPMVAALIALGKLRRIQDHDDLQSKVGKAIDRRSIHEVLQFIKSSFDTTAQVPDGHESLAKAAEKTHVTMQAILEMLFGMHLKTVCLLAGKHGFSRVMVSPAEIMDCIANPPDGASNEIRFWMP